MNMKNFNVKRIISFWIDLIIIGFIACITTFFIMNINHSFNIYSIIFIILGCFLIFLFKDIIGGASIGKRLFNLYIGNQDEPIQSVKKYKLILRNCTYILWPIEGILLLTTGKRIGDRITNTIVYSKQESNQCRPPQNNPLFR